MFVVLKQRFQVAKGELKHLIQVRGDFRVSFLVIWISDSKMSELEPEWVESCRKSRNWRCFWSWTTSLERVLEGKLSKKPKESHLLKVQRRCFATYFVSTRNIISFRFSQQSWRWRWSFYSQNRLLEPIPNGWPNINSSQAESASGSHCNSAAGAGVFRNVEEELQVQYPHPNAALLGQDAKWLDCQSHCKKIWQQPTSTHLNWKVVRLACFHGPFLFC